MNNESRQEDRRLRTAMLDALPRLQRFARSLTGHRQNAEDLMQMTVERVLEKSVPENVDVLRWMFKVCRNLWIDEIRARDVRRRAALREWEEEEGARLDGEAVALGEIGLHEVDRAMRRLPEEQRVVISLVAVEGLSYREAAEVIGCPVGTVMSRLARARAALALQLSQHRKAEGAAHERA